MRSYTPQSLQMAFVMILTMPIVVVYPFLQKYYVKGVMIGAVKG
jgi:putative aldouronate transport system permease protein